MNYKEDYGRKRSIGVRVRNNDIEGALRLLKRKLKKDDFFKEMKAREFYTKPSVLKKLKRRRKKSANGTEL